MLPAYAKSIRQIDNFGWQGWELVRLEKHIEKKKSAIKTSRDNIHTYTHSVSVYSTYHDEDQAATEKQRCNGKRRDSHCLPGKSTIQNFGDELTQCLPNHHHHDYDDVVGCVMHYCTVNFVPFFPTFTKKVYT